MRLILSNADAARLHQTLAAAGELEPNVDVEFKPPKSAVLLVHGERFTGRARPTPSERGVLRVEDMDGNVVMAS
jgi:hypothetical protein